MPLYIRRDIVHKQREIIASRIIATIGLYPSHEGKLLQVCRRAKRRGIMLGETMNPRGRIAFRNGRREKWNVIGDKR